MKVHKPAAPRPLHATGAAAKSPAVASPKTSGWSPQTSPRAARARVAAPVPEVPKSALESLSTTAAFAAMNPLQQAQLSTLTTGTSHLADRARWGLNNVLTSPEYLAATPADQVKQIFTALGSTPVLPGVVTIDAADQLSPHDTATVSGPTLQPAREFHGKTTDADRYDVTIEGQKIPVYLPHDGSYTPPGQHTLDDAVKALTMLPAASRALVKEVNLDPVKNPQDAFWAQTYNQPNFSSYMTCGSEGVVDIYPQEQKGDFKYMADSMVHETGHAWSNAKWGDDPQGAKWAPWRDAAAKDGLLPSDYAKSSPEEDVAESTALYLAMKGTPLFDEYRKLYPNRFALLDTQFGGQS
jgi:hypothetical protein